MLLLVSGSSCAGKTTVREHVAPRLGPAYDAVELKDLGPLPALLDVPWRQRTTELAVRRAATSEGHVLLAGDPVAPGEALAAPSADEVDVAICLLDVSEPVQRQRLARRGDPAGTHDDHVAFATWMRGHAADPTHLPHVLWHFGADPDMRWERWTGLGSTDPRWRITVIDGDRPEQQVAADVEACARAAVAGDAPVFRAGWWR